MKNHKTAGPDRPALPDVPGMADSLPEALLWPLRMQEVLWRETLLGLARMAELRAECLRNLAHVHLPTEAAAVQSDYARKLLDAAQQDGARLARALKDAAPRTRA
ncbi:hypothetical protein [Paracoccus shandongensis]|uniref:hypothetical protein n=1 Tax=Paracoccus shandongensis TaxID=2816048 RepID=UPI001A907A65|nr:hypothetical protein [Paracoccus shandongensis]